MLVIITYMVYLAVSVALTVWVGRALFNNGRVFLVDIFRGNEALASSVNQLLLVGFYLVNLGYVVLTLATSGEIATARVAIEKLSLTPYSSSCSVSTATYLPWPLPERRVTKL